MNTESENNFQMGLMAYQEGRLDQAAEAFKSSIAADSNNWQARFYLAMAYGRLGRPTDAKREFLSIRDLCPDSELRKKAGSAVAAMVLK